MRRRPVRLTETILRRIIQEEIEKTKVLNESSFYYIETHYTDEDGNEIPMLGSDGTTVLRRMPKEKDIRNHIAQTKRLKGIKPFLIGDVVYKVVDERDKVLKVIHDTIE